jgi:hypothetical protein
LVGTPTNGAGGGPTRVELPDGTPVAISRALGIRANGVVFEGHGIPPHTWSAPTISDLRAGRDAALDLAQEWVLSDRPIPARSQSLPSHLKETKTGPVTVYDTAEKIRFMHPCTGTVVTRGPCFAYLKTEGGRDFHIGSPGNTAEIARFLETLKEGQSHRFPESFLKFQGREAAQGGFQSQFYPHPLADEWTQWILGEWQGEGEGNAGSGRGKTRFELALGGQFLIARGEAEITGLDPEFLKKQMKATDAEIERFQRSGYQSLEFYTLDPASGQVIGYLFDNLRCVATGVGHRANGKEIMEWQWRTGHQSTRITERVGRDRIRIVERTPLPDGSVMEDRGEMRRIN